MAVARLQKLDGDDCAWQRSDQLESRSAVAIWLSSSLKPCVFEDAVELLDQPAPLVPFDDAPCLFCIRHRVS